MKDQLQHLIDTMRKHVMKNLDLIKTNEGHIREVLAWPLSPERTRELNESYNFSRSLLSENNDFINLQVTVMNFINKYKNIIEEETVKISVMPKENTQHLSRDEYFRLTVSNDIPFDAVHPYYNDNLFFEDLLLYYEQSENYEMCAKILKKKQ